MMEIVWIVAGIALILVTTADVFMTVLYYDDVGFLSRRLYRGLWSVIRTAFKRAPERRRQNGLALGVPLMIVLTLVMWLGLIVLGFGLLYTVGIGRGHFALSEGLPEGLLTGVYLSAVSLSTLGYGDVTPLTAIYKIVTSLQALTGLSIVALGVSYVLNINQVVRELSKFGGHLRNETGGGTNPRDILVPHFVDGEARGIGDRLYQLHESLLSHFEGIRHYPIVYYFYSHRSHASTPYIFRSVGEIIAALRWGLPKDHPASRDPWLPTLVEDYIAITRHITERFPVRMEGESVAAVSYEDFAREFPDPSHRCDRWVARFLDLDHWMGDLARLPMRADPREVYERYKSWLRFAALVDAFVRATGEDLGHLPPRMEPRAGEAMRPA